MKRVFLLLFAIFPMLAFSQCLDGDCQNGKGEYKFKNGIYVGEFVGGEISGEGEFVTKRGYSYNGFWENGIKSGQGVETIKKTLKYEGAFAQGQRHGPGTAVFEDTKYMQEIFYDGSWENGAPCGEGEQVYFREVRYGKHKVIEKNHLIGNFINGVYQGRITSPYKDELSWEPFVLKMENFQKQQRLTEKERKRLKNPATITTDIALSCECVGGIILFDANAILREDHSFWSNEDIPTKTKPIILNTMQRQFDIVEWYTKELEIALNKEKLACNSESLLTAWSILNDIKKECFQTSKLYLTETAWNPTKGKMKNKKPQQSWDKKIAQKIKKYDKSSKRIEEKLRKRLEKEDTVSCFSSTQLDFSPIKKDSEAKENTVAKKDGAEKKSFKPSFPRSNHLE
tara:strand:+ start:39380 stop:40576 length:1197 start_codon:yes stop_codon:yes gene_type:complete